MWHVSSRSGAATLRTAIHLLLTYLLDRIVLVDISVGVETSANRSGVVSDGCRRAGRCGGGGCRGRHCDVVVLVVVVVPGRGRVMVTGAVRRRLLQLV